MAAFAIGTALPLLAIGLFSAKLIANPKTSEKFLKTAGILIIFFVLYNIDFQFGIVRHFTDRQQPEQIQNNNQNPIAQVIKATYSQSGGIVPNAFEVKVGQPVRLEIAAQDDGFGCMSTVMVPGLYNYPQALKKGKTLIMEFTPNKVGTYQITCAMGVPWGTIIVK